MDPRKTEWWMTNKWETLWETETLICRTRKPKWFLPLVNFVRGLYYRAKGVKSYRCTFTVVTPKNWDGYIRRRYIIDAAPIS